MTFSPQANQRRARSDGHGFTLIEILIVIAIIGILVSILLPALRHAKAAGQKLKCSINMKQIMTAAVVYSQDYKDQLWTAANWADADPSPTVFTPGLLFDYVEYADFIVECPTNKRASAGGAGNGTNGFGWNRDLNFDYTMFDETQGAKLSNAIYAGYVRPNAATPAQLPVNQVATLTMFRSLPIFIEESTPIYNQVYTDGFWGNDDQVTNRHDKAGHIGYLDGTIDLFRPTVGTRDDLVEENLDFEANDVYASTILSDNSWFKITDRNQRYGWINRPRLQP
ncbi:MAG: prepilin-type N-terminal cleavage/methylation domain-containing protein [Phycisphaerales bacterium]